jgi:hypothetical protein
MHLRLETAGRPYRTYVPLASDLTVTVASWQASVRGSVALAHAWLSLSPGLAWLAMRGRRSGRYDDISRHVRWVSSSHRHARPRPH